MLQEHNVALPKPSTLRDTCQTRAAAPRHQWPRQAFTWRQAVAQPTPGRWLQCSQVLSSGGDLPVWDPRGFLSTLLHPGLPEVRMPSLGRGTGTPTTRVQNAGAKAKDRETKPWDELQCFSQHCLLICRYRHHKLLLYHWASLLNESSVFYPLPCLAQRTSGLPDANLVKICWALQRAFPEWYHSLREALLFPGYFSKILACPPFPCFALEVDTNTTNSLWAILHFPGRYNNLLLFHRHSRGYLVFRLPVLWPLRGFLCDTTVTQVITSSKYVISASLNNHYSSPESYFLHHWLKFNKTRILRSPCLPGHLVPFKA